MSFPLLENLQEFIAGSLPDNQIYLPYRGVSRRHFSLIRSGQDWLVKDLGSTNGTKVNGTKVQEIKIHPGDKVQAGVVECELQESEQEILVETDSGEMRMSAVERTDEIAAIPASKETPFYSFPGLVLPEGMVLGRPAKCWRSIKRFIRWQIVMFR